MNGNTHPCSPASLIAALASAGIALMATSAHGAESLACQSAKLSAQVNHARCIVRCQGRPSERVQPCETQCDQRLTRRLQILQSASVCTGTTQSPAANNEVCDLQLLKASWKQVKCYLRCERLGVNSTTFHLTRCNDKCVSKFNRTRARVMQQPVCAHHSGQMPSIN